jgi:hypothetical protein
VCAAVNHGSGSPVAEPLQFAGRNRLAEPMGGLV